MFISCTDSVNFGYFVFLQSFVRISNSVFHTQLSTMRTSLIQRLLLSSSIRLLNSLSYLLVGITSRCGRLICPWLCVDTNSSVILMEQSQSLPKLSMKTTSMHPIAHIKSMRTLIYSLLMSCDRNNQLDWSYMTY